MHAKLNQFGSPLGIHSRICFTASESNLPIVSIIISRKSIQMPCTAGQKGPQVPSSHLACITESCTSDIVVICLAAPQAKLVLAVFRLKIM